jgi:2-C-methyl-D-erythritol 4-phosphate cytidylyltransferase
MKKEHRFVHGVADFIRAIAGKNKHESTSAVIVAAGDSSRMGENKQFVTLDGIPVIARTVEAFEKSECIKEIIIVTRKEDISNIIDLCEKHKFRKVAAVVPGGTTRQESVKLGFDEVSDKSYFVAIHDGARCLITPDMVENICREAYIYGAAIAANRVVDTVKRTEKGSFAEETLDRNRIWLAQTPQVFNCNIYRAALYTADNDKFTGTDDASLVEHIGYKSIKLVECGRENIKLTTPNDIPFAEALLTARKRGEVKRK